MGMNTSANKARKEAGMRVRNRSDNTDPAVLCYPGHARLERVRFVRFGPLYQNGCQRAMSAMSRGRGWIRAPGRLCARLYLIGMGISARVAQQMTGRLKCITLYLFNAVDLTRCLI